MSDEVPETDADVLDEGLDDLSVDDYKKIVAKLRREAGSRRVANKENEQKLKEYEDWKKSQMSEVERVRAEKAELEQTLGKYKLLDMKGEIAQRVGLNPQDADLISGDSEDEMVRHAKSLKARLTPGTATASDMRPGGRGTPVGESTELDKDAWLRSLWGIRQ
jgi:DNA repair ATPase RecN